MSTTLQHHADLDRLEEAMQGHPPVDCPVVHRFTPGMYIREILIPAGTLLTSAIHLTEHPFVISAGRIVVFSENEGRQLYEAPFTGITLPGTRRTLLAIDDTIWTTFHATQETDVATICATILDDRKNPLLPQNFLPHYLP